jgi:hypothetical protein
VLPQAVAPLLLLLELAALLDVEDALEADEDDVLAPPAPPPDEELPAELLLDVEEELPAEPLLVVEEALELPPEPPLDVDEALELPPEPLATLRTELEAHAGSASAARRKLVLVLMLGYPFPATDMPRGSLGFHGFVGCARAQTVGVRYKVSRSRTGQGPRSRTAPAHRPGPTRALSYET